MLNCIVLLYGVRARMAGTLAAMSGRMTSARSTTPSRVFISTSVSMRMLCPTAPPSEDGVTAVDGDRVAGVVAAGVAGQVDRDAGEIVRVADATLGDTPHHHVAQLRVGAHRL